MEKPKEDDGNLYYLDAVEEALCFGWIDTTKKKYNDDIVIQKFTPRWKNSNWTELNKERCRRLNKLGLMHSSGLIQCQQYLNQTFEIDNEIMNKIKEDEELDKEELKRILIEVSKFDVTKL